MPKRLKRSSSLVLYWENGQLICEDYLGRNRYAVTPEVVRLLDQFGTARNIRNGGLAGSFQHADRRAVEETIKFLSRQGILRESETEAERALKDWHWGAAARHFLFSTKAAHVHLSRSRRMAHAKKLLASSKQPPLYKEYARAKQVSLPRPRQFESQAGSLLSSIRDVRSYHLKPIPKEWLSEILLLSCGEQGKIPAEPWGKLLRKTYYSAGNRHPIEIYPVVVSVDGLEPGLYHYNVKKHGLELLKRGDFSREVRKIANSQTWVKNASVYFLMTAVFGRTSFKYRHDYFLRSIFIDAGHISQSVYLGARSLGLGACATHALRHDLAEKFLEIDGVRESFIFFLTVG